MVKQGFTATNSVILGLMTVGYIVGEIAHFQIGTVSRSMAQDIEFGRKKCFEEDVDDSDYCRAIDNEEGYSQESFINGSQEKAHKWPKPLCYLNHSNPNSGLSSKLSDNQRVIVQSSIH